MQIPRDIYELADSVESLDDIDEAVKTSAWARAFLLSPPFLDPVGGPDRRELFFFLVSCSLIIKLKEKETDKLLKLLELVRQRFFSDDQLWKANIALKDIRNVQDEIFRIYYIDGIVKNLTLLKTHILSLRQDKAIRSSLEPVYGDFLKNPRLHPANVFQQCILSLL